MKREISKWTLGLLTFLFTIPVWGATPSANIPLTATATLDSSWNTGYQVTVLVQNKTANPTTNWTVIFTLPQGQTISSLWNGVYSANGSTITVTNPTWSGGGVIPANGSTTFGLVVNGQVAKSLLGPIQASGNGTVTVSPPGAPVLNPITPSGSSYVVSWSSVPNATSYTLQQSLTNTFSNPTVVAQGPMLSQLFANPPNGTYYYRVSASNSAGPGPFSAIQSITINASVAAPILQPIANPAGLSTYTLNWSAVLNAQTYTLQTASDGCFTNPVTLYVGSTPSFQIVNQSLGTYYYRVSASSGTITSAYSNIQSTVVTQLPPPHTNAIVEGYWESWNSTDPVSAIVQMNVEIIDIAFANFLTTGPHTFQISGVECDQATLTQLVTLAHNAGKKVKISVGGATYPLSGQLQTTQDAIGMAQAVAQYVQQNNLDGVDYDIEDYPAPDLQVALIQNTRQLLGNTALISYTAKAPASTTYPYYQVIQSAYQYLTVITIMAYDYAPGYSYHTDISTLMSKGVPGSMILVGLMPGYDDQHVMTSLSDIAAAANYVVSNNLGGVIFWDLNRDYENITGLGPSAATTTASNII